MGGFKPDAIREAFNLARGRRPEDRDGHRPVRHSADVAPEIRQRDAGERLPLTDLLIRRA